MSEVNILVFWERLDNERKFEEMINLYKALDVEGRALINYHMKMTEPVFGEYNIVKEGKFKDFY